MEKKNFTIELLEVYRSLPALWDTKCKEYANKYKKNDQYEILLKKYNEEYPDAGKKELTQKINSLRTNYRKELKRIAALEKSGAGVHDAIEPNLYYFDAMSFLRRNEEPSTSRSSLDLNETVEENETQFQYGPSKRRKGDANDELIALASKELQEVTNPFEKKTAAWAVQLEEMVPQQRIFAEKFINDILFEGLMETLHRNAISFNTLTRSSSTPSSYASSATSPQLVQLPMMSPQISMISRHSQCADTSSLSTSRPFSRVSMASDPKRFIGTIASNFGEIEDDLSSTNTTVRVMPSQEQQMEGHYSNVSDYFSNFM